MGLFAVLLEGPEFYLELMKAALHGYDGRLGSGEGDVRAVGCSHQEPMMLVVLVVRQVGGVARCRRLGVAKAGRDVREGDPGHLLLQGRGHFRPKMGAVLHVGEAGGKVEVMGRVGRCPRERPVSGSEVARRDRVPTGEVVAESRPMGAGEEPWPAGAEAVGRIAEAEFFVVADPESDILVGLGGTRRCTRGEGNSHG